MNKNDLFILLLLLAPLTGSFIALIASSNKFIVRLSSVLLNTIVFLLLISNQQVVQISTWKWLKFGSTSVDFTFELNRSTLPLTLMTSFIGLLVNIYSIGFFKWEKSQSRYWSTLNFFTFSMLGLTLSGNLFQTFIFWELIGLSSYLLISFYRDKEKAVEAGTKALIMNKIGDVGFIIALMAVYVSSQTLDIQNLELSSIPNGFSWIIGIGLAIAIFSKSAQFPFHTWLPDAMEGPTPISALMHSATMVAAGVYVLIRFHFLIPVEIMEAIAIVGLVTAVIGGLIALRESELKKLLAWSTISQLGLMVMVAGSTSFLPSYLYLLTHALFKAGLFLVTGLMISSTGLSTITELKSVPKSIVLFLTIIVLVLSLMGFPLTIGFIAKEYMVNSITSPFFLGAFFLINGFTVLYAGRILSIILPIPDFKSITTESLYMMAPIIILGAASLWFLYSVSPFSVSWIEDDLGLEPPKSGLTIFSLAWVTLLTFFSLLLIRKNKINNVVDWMPAISLDQFYQNYLIKPILFVANITHQTDYRIIDKSLHGFVYTNFSIALLIRWFDRSVVDGFVKLLALLVKATGNFFRQFVAGKIQDYIWWTIVTLIILFVVSRI